MGYTGLIDYNDQSGLGSRSDLKSRPTPQAPLIILDGENALSKRNTRRVNIPYNDGGSYFWNKADKNSPDYIDTRKQYSEWLKEQRSR